MTLRGGVVKTEQELLIRTANVGDFVWISD